MTMMEKLLRSEKIKMQLALWRLPERPTIKECADKLGIAESMAEYYWDAVKRQIHGRLPRHKDRYRA